MQLLSLAEDFLQYLRHEQNATPFTCRDYRSQLRHFFAWIAAHGYPQPRLTDFTTPLLRRYQYSLSGRGLRPRTIRGYMTALRSFGTFLCRNGVLAENPALSVRMPKKDAPLQHTVSEEEIEDLLRACERQRNPYRAALCRAVLAALVFGGLRRMELVALETGDVDFTECCLRVRQGKGRKARSVYVCDDCLAALREWLAMRPKDVAHNALFLSDRRRKLAYNGLATLIEDLKARAGFADRKHIHPHALRRAAATRLLRNGADIRTVQAFLGHSSLAVTSQYLCYEETHAKATRELTALRPKPTEAPEPAVADLRDQRREGEHRARLRRVGIR